jgi:hypothetical protein
MHGFEDLRLLLTLNFIYFLCYIGIIDLFLINDLYTEHIRVG